MHEHRANLPEARKEQRTCKQIKPKLRCPNAKHGQGEGWSWFLTNSATETTKLSTLLGNSAPSNGVAVKGPGFLLKVHAGGLSGGYVQALGKTSHLLFPFPNSLPRNQWVRKSSDGHPDSRRPLLTHQSNHSQDWLCSRVKRELGIAAMGLDIKEQFLSYFLDDVHRGG